MNCILEIVKCTVLLVLLSMSQMCYSRLCSLDVTHDSISNECSNDTVSSVRKGNSILDFASRTIDKASNFLMGCDTTYITPQLYEFTAQAEVTYWHDYYRISSKTTGNSMTIESSHPLILGAYVCWGIFGYGHYVNVNDIGFSGKETYGTSQRNSFTINTARLVAEIYTFRSGKSSEITSVTDIDITGKDNSFSGLSSKCYGFNAEYIFNHKKYSWPAAFGMNAVQRKSAGSWKLGFSYNHQKISFNNSELPSHLNGIDKTLLFKNVDYKDYAISFGYSYNWVFRKNCLFAISLLPSLGYRMSSIRTEWHDNSFLSNLSTDVITRASLFWNNTKYFSGLILEFHTYSYREAQFGLTNSYGTLKYVLGLNFLKKKDKK